MMGFQNGTDWTSFGTKSRALPENVKSASDSSPIEKVTCFPLQGILQPNWKGLVNRCRILGLCHLNEHCRRWA